MPLLEGVKDGGEPAPIPLNADGSAVACEIENVSLTVDTTGLATSAKQSDGSQKTQVVDGSGNVAPAGDAAARASFVKLTNGTQTMPTGDAAARPVFVELSDGSAAVGTSGNPVRVNPTAVVASASTDTGQNLSLSDTNSHPFGTSAAATIGVLVSAPAENTATVYVGLATGVTSGATGKGYPLVPGASIFLRGILNSNLVYAITGAATQNVHALAI
jgi:hypothetical protein